MSFEAPDDHLRMNVAAEAQLEPDAPARRYLI